jgi:hypothetical protein
MSDFTFTITSPIEVEETLSSSIILNGTFMKLNHITNNGREYQLEEAQEITEGLIGMPVGYGTQWWNNKHRKDAKHHIGRVIKTIFDEVNGVIKGVVEIWNTKEHPDIVQQIKPGWGFSIGGKAQNLVPTGLTNSLGKAIMKVIGMKPNHLQIVEPQKNRGQSMAKVEGEGDVEESYEEVSFGMRWDPCPWGVCEIQVTDIEESEEKKIWNTEAIMLGETKITAEDFIDLQNRLDALENPEPEPEPEEEVVVAEPVRKRKVYIVEDPDSTLV